MDRTYGLLALKCVALLAIPAYFWWDYLHSEWGPLGKYGSWRSHQSMASEVEAEYRKAGFTFPSHVLKNGAEAKYALYVPPSYANDELRSYPLVVFLHGRGERGTDGVAPLKNGLPAGLIHAFPEWKRTDLEFVAVFPQGLTGYWGPGDDDVELAMAIVAEVERTYRIDLDRLCLTGLSNGGTGVWALAAAFPERWAAIVPVAATPDKNLASAIRHIPCWCFHGGKDKVALASEVREMIRVLQQLGRAAWYTEFPEAGHSVWGRTFDTPNVYKWMLAQRRGQPAIPPKPLLLRPSNKK